MHLFPLLALFTTTSAMTLGTRDDHTHCKPTDKDHAYLVVNYSSEIAGGSVDVGVWVEDNTCKTVSHWDANKKGSDHPDVGDCFSYDGAPYAVCITDLRGGYGGDNQWIEFKVGAAIFGKKEGDCDCQDGTHGLVAVKTCYCKFLKIGRKIDGGREHGGS